MKRLLLPAVVIAIVLLALCLAGVAESQCVQNPNGTCQVPQRSQWQASKPLFPGLQRPLVPVRTAVKHIITPRPNINVQPAAPNVNVLPDPAVGEALTAIARNTAPPAEPPPQVLPATEATPLASVLCVLGGVALAFVLFYVVGKN